MALKVKRQVPAIWPERTRKRRTQGQFGGTLGNLSVHCQSALKHTSGEREHLGNLFHVNLCCRLDSSTRNLGPWKTLGTDQDNDSRKWTVATERTCLFLRFFLLFFFFTAFSFQCRTVLATVTVSAAGHTGRTTTASLLHAHWKALLFGNYQQQKPALFLSSLLSLENGKRQSRKCRKAYFTCLLFPTHTEGRLIEK